MPERKQIVVGVDGSACSQRALRHAAEEAKTHGGDVLAVSAWTAPTPLAAPGFAAYPLSADFDAAGTARRVLQETVSEVLGDAPEVPVHTRVSEGHASKVLVELSEEADLVVVGSRGHGGFAGLLLGSVSQQVVGHAACAVTVVR